MKPLTIISIIFFCNISFAKVFQVGPTRAYTAPSKVMNLVSDGDTVEIDAGVYSGDVGTWTKNNLVIRGVGGYAHLDAAGKNESGKAIWVLDGKNTYIENIEFSGCTVPDHNGAGIRLEADKLELRHCYFHDNEDGVLTGASPTSDILFEACEFARNGYGDGYSHNMYIGNVRTFTMRFCYSHHAKVGHCVKSRAMNNFIYYNRIMDEDTGSASYLINLPNGGFSIVLGNVMQKGVNAQNERLIDYGSEGLSNPAKQLYITNNTLVSQRPGGAIFVQIAPYVDTVKIINNIFAGKGTIIQGNADTITNSYSQDIAYFGFLNPNLFDFRPLLPPYNIQHAGTIPVFADTFDLTPHFEYKHPLDSMKRVDVWILGALQGYAASVSEQAKDNEINNFPNPFSDKTTIDLGTIVNEPVTITVYNQLGEIAASEKIIPENPRIVFERGNLVAGVYDYVIVNTRGERIANGKFIIQ